MKNKYILLLLIILVPVFKLSAQQYQWYGNARFGFSFTYPKNMEAEPPPEINDGIIVRDKTGLVITCSGMYNALEATLSSETDEAVKGFDKVTYQKKGKNWFVVSGYVGYTIKYIKCFLGKEQINTITLEYPIELKQKYDKTVSKVVSSFKPGKID